LFLFHARRVRTRTDRPHSPTLPGLPPANVAQRPKRCHTKMNARERVCVHKNKKPFASDSSSVAAVPAAPACSPFSSCRGGEKDRHNPKCLQCCSTRNTFISLNPKGLSPSLSLSWVGRGVGGHRQTHLRRQRVLRLLCCCQRGSAAGRGQQNNLATLE
jgi:hypothetical protein